MSELLLFERSSTYYTVDVSLDVANLLVDGVTLIACTYFQNNTSNSKDTYVGPHVTLTASSTIVN